MTDRLFEDAGLSLDWAHEFVVQSNEIDPQPGDNSPGSPLFDLHYAALAHAISLAMSDRFALPRELHMMLLPGHQLSGALRTQHCTIGFKRMLQAGRVQHFTWRWNVDARETIGQLRTQPGTADERQDLIWDLHCELMNIRPFELYNGRVGRLIMVNHALLLGEEPTLIRSSERESYIDAISAHPSATWVNEPLYKPSTVRYREW